MLYADRDYDKDDTDGEDAASDRSKPVVTVENCTEKGYSMVNLRCKDRPKLLFDTVCTLTDMQYVVFHATVIAEGPEAYQVCANSLWSFNTIQHHDEQDCIQDICMSDWNVC